MFNRLYLTTFAAALGVTNAATSISDSTMTNWLNAGGAHLAWSYAPVWFFSAAMGNIPCIPTWTYNSGTETPYDTYESQFKTLGASLCGYPDVGCKCRHPGVDAGNKCAQFPIYYTYTKCGSNNDEVRIAYNLFYQKDGTTSTGHAYDWERIITSILKTSDNKWSPSSIAMSRHSRYTKKLWQTIQNTLTTDQAVAGNGPTPNGITNQDHPKIYIAWSKHANFDDRNTGWNDVIPQSTDNAFRGQDWWAFIDEKYYIRADSSTEAGRTIHDAGWDDASSDPVSVHSGICSV